MPRAALAFALTLALTLPALPVAGATPPRVTAADDQFVGEARALAELRAEIERLEADLQVERETTRSRVQGLRAQALEIDLLVQRERVRIADLEELVAKRETKREEQLTRVSHLTPPLSAAIDQLRQLVRDGVPFHTEERLAELDEVQRKLEGQRIDPETAASRLWQFVEDELRLCEETELQRQVVEHDGARKLLRVVRVGMVGLFARVAEGQYLRAVRDDADGATWGWEPIDGLAANEALDAAVEALRKQLRSGPARLPLRLALTDGTATVRTADRREQPEGVQTTMTTAAADEASTDGADALPSTAHSTEQAGTAGEREDG